jgi:hypothetical protein
LQTEYFPSIDIFPCISGVYGQQYEFYGYVIFNFCLHWYELLFIGMKNVSNKVVEKYESGFVRISDLSEASRFEDNLNKHCSRQNCIVRIVSFVACSEGRGLALNP